jgi:AraC-like DNA-binding protein
VGLDGAALECFSTNFKLYLLNGGETALPLPLITNIGYRADIVARYMELNNAWLRRERGYVMYARARFMLILHQYMETIIYNADHPTYDERVKKAIRFITDHYAEPLSIHMVASEVSLNPVYFGALFKQSTGVTFRQYLLSIRLNQAEDMLRNGSFNVNETSRNCGFADIFYFSRIFKKIKGVPPSQISVRAKRGAQL